MNRYVFITLEWAIYFDIYHGSPFIEVATMFLQQPQIDKLLYKASFRHYVFLAKNTDTRMNK